MKKQLKILVIEPNWLGDVIFTTPAFEAIKASYPDSFLGVVTARRCAAILENNPYVDKIYPLDEKKEEKGFFAKIKFIKKIRSENYTWAIFFHRSFTKTLLIILSGVKKRTGYAYRKRAWFLTEKIPLVNKDSLHKQDYYLNILEKTGIKLPNKNCKLYISEEENKKAIAFINKNNPKKIKQLIAINPFSNWKPKNWPLENYLQLIKIALKENPNRLFFITAKNKFSDSLCSFKEKTVDLSGKTTLRQLAALYKNIDLVISGDSGPLHIAAAVGTQYIAIFGPTSPDCTKPKSKTKGCVLVESTDCQTPCYQSSCNKNYQCIKKITPEKVSQAIENALCKQDA